MPRDERTAMTSLDDLSVTITVEMDHKEMTFAQLDALVDGDVIEFSEKRTDTVRLLANGMHFADATLILIDDTVAVRIDELY